MCMLPEVFGVRGTPLVMRVVRAVKGVGALMRLFLGVSGMDLLLRLLLEPVDEELRSVFDADGDGLVTFGRVFPPVTNG